MSELWVFLFIFAAVFVVMIIRQNLQLGKIQIERLNQEVQIPPEIETWTGEHGFSFEGYYTTAAGENRFDIYAWRHSERSLFYCIYVTGAAIGKGRALSLQTMDFVSIFDDDYVLTTSNRNHRTGACMRRTYKQSFSKPDMEIFRRKHYEMEEYLLANGAKPLSVHVDFKETLEAYVRQEMLCHRKSILWPLVILYWYFIGKHFWHNRSIQEQYERGMIKLPREQYLEHIPSWRDA